MREISLAVGISADDFLRSAPDEVKQIVAEIRREKRAGLRKYPSAELLDCSRELTTTQWKPLLDKVAALVHENLCGRSKMCQQFVRLDVANLNPMLSSDCSQIGTGSSNSCRSANESPSPGRRTRNGWPITKLVQQIPCLPECCCVEAFRKPAVNFGRTSAHPDGVSGATMGETQADDGRGGHGHDERADPACQTQALSREGARCPRRAPSSCVPPSAAKR